jgi:hypothetical protein
MISNGAIVSRAYVRSGIFRGEQYAAIAEVTDWGNRQTPKRSPFTFGAFGASLRAFFDKGLRLRQEKKTNGNRHPIIG